MRNLHSTLTRLSAMRQRLDEWNDVSDDRLPLFSGFGSNPGNLQAREYLPSGLRPGAPLVVILHGCTQTPGGYNQSANWTRAADEHGFALLFPEQQSRQQSEPLLQLVLAEGCRPRPRGGAVYPPDGLSNARAPSH